MTGYPEDLLKSLDGFQVVVVPTAGIKSDMAWAYAQAISDLIPAVGTTTTWNPSRLFRRSSGYPVIIHSPILGRSRTPKGAALLHRWCRGAGVGRWGSATSMARAT